MAVSLPQLRHFWKIQISINAAARSEFGQAGSKPTAQPLRFGQGDPTSAHISKAMRQDLPGLLSAREVNFLRNRRGPLPNARTEGPTPVRIQPTDPLHGALGSPGRIALRERPYYQTHQNRVYSGVSEIPSELPHGYPNEYISTTRWGACVSRWGTSILATFPEFTQGSDFHGRESTRESFRHDGDMAFATWYSRHQLKRTCDELSGI